MVCVAVLPVKSIKRIEKVGLKIVALEMSMPTRELIDNHYPKDEKWITRVGEKTSNTYAKFEMDLSAGTRNH